MQELKIGDTVIAGVPDHVAEQIVKAAKAAHGQLRTTHGSGLLLERLVPGLCRLTVPLEVVIEYWPPDSGKQQVLPLSPRQQRLDARVEMANKLSLLGQFVTGKDEWATIKTHGMEMRLSASGRWMALMFSENEPLHGNPRGTRSVIGWGYTKDEAAKDAFALLWLGE